MTRIIRMRLPSIETKEWVSVLSGKGEKTYRIIPQEGEEFEIVDNGQEPLEDQITKALSKRMPAHSE